MLAESGIGVEWTMHFIQMIVFPFRWNSTANFTDPLLAYKPSINKKASIKAIKAFSAFISQLMHLWRRIWKMCPINICRRFEMRHKGTLKVNKGRYAIEGFVQVYAILVFNSTFKNVSLGRHSCVRCFLQWIKIKSPTYIWRRRIRLWFISE